MLAQKFLGLSLFLTKDVLQAISIGGLNGLQRRPATTAPKDFLGSSEGFQSSSATVLVPVFPKML